MKRICTLLFVSTMAVAAIAQQAVKEINVSTPGTLKDLLAPDDAVKKLKVTGKINDADFNTLNTLKNLEVLDLLNAAIVDKDGKDTGAIPDYAFDDNRTLTKITMPSSLQKVGTSSFHKCKSLHEVVFSEGVKSIRRSAFMSCQQLTTVNLPQTLETIGDKAFYKTLLDSFTSPTALTTIGISAFYGTNVGKAVIGANITKIGESAFGGCYRLATFEVNESNTKYRVVDNVLFDKDTTTLVAYPQADVRTDYSTPKTVTSIYMSAFDCAAKLQSLRINEGVTSIPVSMCFSDTVLTELYLPSTITAVKAGAFDNCRQLAKFHIRAVTPPEADGGAFGVMFPNPKMNLYVPRGSVEKYKKAYAWRDAFVTYNEEEEYSIRMTTERETGQYISLSMVAEGDVEVEGAAYDSPGRYKITDKNIVIKGRIIRLDCASDKLSALDISHSPALKQLYCDDNSLTSIIIGGNDVLATLYCGNNQLTQIDLSQLPALEDFSCWGNSLTALDLSHNPKLKSLICRDNKLTGTLDLSGNAKLNQVNCYNNAISFVKLAHDTELKHIELERNQIYGNNMTDFMKSLPTYVAFAADEWDDWYGMNPQGLYVTEIDPAKEKNVAYTSDVKIAKDKGWPVYAINIEDYGDKKPTPYDGATPDGIETATTERHITILPNPASDTAYIDGVATGDTITIYDINGKETAVYVASGNRLTIDLTGLVRGVYLIKGKRLHEKLIVK